MKNFKSKLKKSFYSIFPITMIVLILALTFGKDSIGTDLIAKLIFGAIFLIIGMGLFTMGADSSMNPIGESVGSAVSKTKKIWLILLTALIIGFLITLAEPDLAVLSDQIGGIDSWLFRIIVSLGTGIFCILAMIKILFNIPYSYLFLASYGLVFILIFFTPKELWGVSFDSGTVTTGAVSVPFLLSFGIGVSLLRSSSTSDDNAFGLLGLSSVGPILAVTIMSFFVDTSSLTIQTTSTPETMGILEELTHYFTIYLKEVAIIIIPIIVVFFVFQFTMLKLPKYKIFKICMGLVYTYLGIVIFLTGVNSGYLAIGAKIGAEISSLDYNWILIPISLIVGYFLIAAEPAVHVLKKQVEDVTGGVIKQKTIAITLSIGISISVALAMLKAMYNINFMYFIVPIYVISFILAFLNKRIFTSIAFDAGGAATGTMGVTFIVPFINAVSSNFENAFGTLAIMSGASVLSIQILGFICVMAVKNKKRILNFKLKKHVRILEFDIEN